MNALKIKNIILVLIAALALSCTKEDAVWNAAENGDIAANQWIYDVMKESYLWREELPSSVNLNRFYYNFFIDLLSDKDGKPNDKGEGHYSYITKYTPRDETTTRAGESYLQSSYGFDYILTLSYLYDEKVNKDFVESKIYATVAYVINGSPADSVGLKRGDHIQKINGKELQTDYYTELLRQLNPPVTGSASQTVTLTLCELEQIGVVESNGWVVPVVVRHEPQTPQRVPRSKEIDHNPILVNTTLEAGGKRIGYLVYNEFDAGGSTGFYDSQLVEVIRDIKSGGIDEFILDLRYNPGGSVSSCVGLANLIVPTGYRGNTFMRGVGPDENFTTTYNPSASNSLERTKIYIIATSYSASASEALLHCLKASGMEVYHIGNRTEGKNVGMTAKTTESLPKDSKQKEELFGYEYLAYPVTFRIMDANNNTYSVEGIDPDDYPGYGHTFYEDFVVDFKQLGDPEEPLLRAALHHIVNGTFPTDDSQATAVPSGRSLHAFTPDRAVSGPVRGVKPSKGFIVGE